MHALLLSSACAVPETHTWVCWYQTYWEFENYFIYFQGNLQKMTYTTAHMYLSAGLEYFAKSGFEWKPVMLDKQMISHLKALDVAVKIYQKQLCSFIRDDHATFLVKDTLFKEEVAWQPLKELESCSPSILEPLSRAFIWGIVCLSIIIGCGEIKDNVKKCQSYVVKTDIFGHNH